MSQSPELPDLDRLQARTYSNGPGNVPRLPDRVVDCLIDSAGVSRLAYDDKDQAAAVERLVHDTCEELLARLPDDRRVQPEGEAPQAVAPKRLEGRQIFEIAAPYFAWNAPSWHKATQAAIGMTGLLAFAEALMKAAPAAQHAESGAQAAQDFAAITALAHRWFDAIGPKTRNEFDRLAVSVRAALAAQSQGAPGALAEACALLRIAREDCGLGSDLGGKVDAFLERAVSAPGTPEAPAEDRKGIALWQATLRACGELPEGYEVRIELENGCGMAVWYDDEGERHVIDGEGYLSDDVNEAIDAAIQRAAQLDGGQGEEERHADQA